MWVDFSGYVKIRWIVPVVFSVKSCVGVYVQVVIGDYENNATSPTLYPMDKMEDSDAIRCHLRGVFAFITWLENVLTEGSYS